MSHSSLDALLEGNERFRTGNGHAYTYTQENLRNLATTQNPIAAVLTCSDSRVAPEIVFDQPLGTMFAARTPGNVSADSVKWMIDIAVENLKVPLFMVVGHTGCLAVTQVVEGNITGPGEPLRAQISLAHSHAKSKNPEDVVLATVKENVFITIDHLMNESYELRRSVEKGTTVVCGAVYDMHTGVVEVLERR